MKICSPQLGLSPTSSLGGEVHDYNLIKELCSRGVEVDVLLPNKRFFTKDENLKVSYLPFTHVVPPHLFNLFALPYLVSKCKEKTGIIRFHNPYFLGLAGIVIKKIFPHVKIVTTIHLKEERVDLDFILRKSINIYDHIFTVSEYLKKWIVKEYHYPENKVSVIYNGVEEVLKPEPKDTNLIKRYDLDGKIVLLNVGSLIDRKNPLFLLDVFEVLYKRYNNLKLIFCGKGYLQKKLIQEINKRGLHEKVILINLVYGENKNKIFNLADIFLFPSLNEGFGLVGVEAMVCGKPLIASENTSLVEIVQDGINGYLAKTSNLDDWVDKTSRLIEEKELRQRFGKAGRQFVKQNFTWRKVAEKTIEIYKDLIK